jgi:hypothetical protein
VLGDPAARVTGHRLEPIAYDFVNPSSGGIYRLRGEAEGVAGPADWSLVLKVTRSPENLGPELTELARAVRDAFRWDRELHAYESGFLAELDGGFVAAASHGGAMDEDGTCWLWLEDLGDRGGAWSLEEWPPVARALGAFNGAFLAEQRVPDADWLGRGWLRAWTVHITPFLFGRALTPGPAWERPAVRTAYPPETQRRIASLWADRDRLLAAVEALPHTCSHLDSHRRNLFRRDGKVVAVDWGEVGLAAPGEEIASSLVGTVASGELPAEQASDFASLLFEGYVDGLRGAGWIGDERDVRLAFTAAAGLRAVSILGLDVAEDPQRASDEVAATLARCSALAQALLDLGDEARRLIRPSG